MTFLRSAKNKGNCIIDLNVITQQRISILNIETGAKIIALTLMNLKTLLSKFQTETISSVFGHKISVPSLYYTFL